MSPAEAKSEYLTPEEFAQEFNVGVSGVYKALRKGLVPGAGKVPGQRLWRIKRDVVEAAFAGETEVATETSDPMPRPRRRGSDSFRSRADDPERRRKR